MKLHFFTRICLENAQQAVSTAAPVGNEEEDGEDDDDDDVIAVGGASIAASAKVGGTTLPPTSQVDAGRRSSAIINRVKEKLSGRDFGPRELDVPKQVELLIEQAKSPEFLCQCYVGWCPFW